MQLARRTSPEPRRCRCACAPEWAAIRTATPRRIPSPPASSAAASDPGVPSDAGTTGSAVENDGLHGCDWKSRCAARSCRASTDSDLRSLAASMNVRISSANRSGSQPAMEAFAAESFLPLPSSFPNRPPPLFGSTSAAVDTNCGMVWVWMCCAPDKRAQVRDELLFVARRKERREEDDVGNPG